MDDDRDETRIVLLGDPRAGKSCFYLRVRWPRRYFNAFEGLKILISHLAVPNDELYMRNTLTNGESCSTRFYGSYASICR